MILVGHPSHVPDHCLNRSNGLSQLFSVYVRDGLSLSSAEWSGTRPFHWWPTTSLRTGPVYFPKLQTLKCSGKETRNITHQVIKKWQSLLSVEKYKPNTTCGHTHRAAASTKLVVHSKWVWTGQAVVTNPVQGVEDVRRRSLPSIYRLNDVCVCVCARVCVCVCAKFGIRANRRWFVWIWGTAPLAALTFAFNERNQFNISIS